MSKYTKDEANEALEVSARVFSQLEGLTPEFACHILSVVMATLIANEVNVLARGHVVQQMQERLASDVVKMATVATEGARPH